MKNLDAKRRYPRIPSENAVLIKKLGPEEGEGFAKTQVVGLGGCMFVTDEPLGVDSYLDLLISVRGRVVQTRGRVAYEIDKGGDDFEVGVEFLEISPHDRAVLHELFRPR